MNTTSPHPVIKIAIADDHVLVLEGLSNVITSFGNFDVIITANDGEELIRKITQSQCPPDICIIDVNMPRQNGWKTIEEIKRKWDSVKVIILSVFEGEDIVRNVIKYDGNGYLCKSCSPYELKTAIEKVYEGDYYFPISYSKLLVKIGSGKSALTKNEMVFLAHCCEEDSYKEIADQMHVSPRTVEGYRDSLFEKLKVKSRVGLAVYAIKNGIVTFFEKSKSNKLTKSNI